MQERDRSILGLPVELVISLTLVGTLLLGLFYYNKAVTLQRFLEPSLAVFKPRITFYANLKRTVETELGSAEVKGLKVSGNSIFVKKALIAADSFHGESPIVMQKIARAFHKVLLDPWMNSNVDFILVSAKAPLTGTFSSDMEARHNVQQISEKAMEILFRSEPKLGQNFSHYFVSSAFTTYLRKDEADWVEFRIVPSERIHIEMILKLQKYTN